MVLPLKAGEFSLSVVLPNEFLRAPLLFGIYWNLKKDN